QLDDTPRVEFLKPASHAPLDGSQEDQQVKQPDTQPETKDPLKLETAPPIPGGVTTESLEELGILIIRAPNKEAAELMIAVIEWISKKGEGAEVIVELVTLKHADATSIYNTLNQVY